VQEEQTNGPTNPADREGIDRSLISGLAWTTGVKWTSQVLTWATTILVARLLIPEDYGLVGMAAVFFGLAQLLAEAGLGASVIRFRWLEETHLRQLHSLSSILGLGGFLASVAMARPLGAFFNAPDLPPVVIVGGMSFVVAGLGIIPYATFQRDLRFRFLAMVDAAQALVAASSTLALAALGAGYWALVLGNLLGAVVFTAVPVWKRPVRFQRPQLRPLREILTYSTRIIAARLAFYVYSTADRLIVGKLIGQAALGVYSYAWTLASLPVEKIAAIITRVTGGVFAAVQDQPAELRRYFLAITEALAVVTVPVALGMALVADDFVFGLLGQQWAEMIVPLQILAFYASIRSIDTVPPLILFVVGEERFAMRIGVGLAIVLPLSFVFAARFGIGAVAMTWVVVYPLFSGLRFLRTFQVIELRARDFVKVIAPTIVSAAIMATLVMITRGAYSGGHLPRLMVSVAVGAAAYVGALFLLFANRVRAIRALLTGLKSRPPEPAPVDGAGVAGGPDAGGTP